ncbi:MAG: hypothetical protein AAGH64_11280 [Planctomycetota bacterium]
MKTVTAAVACAMALASGAQASITNVVDSPINSFADLGTFAPLNLSSSVGGLSGANNTLSVDFDSALSGGLGFLKGNITSEVFGNVSTPGGSLTDVVIRYTLSNTGFDEIDAFDFGVNTGNNVNAADLLAPSTTQGRILGESTPLVDLPTPDVFVDTTTTNTLWTFDFEAALTTLAVGETLSWYVRSNGAVAIDRVDVTVKNAEDAEAVALVFIDPTAGQPDLGVPAPGAIALAGAAGLMGVRRRRA